MLKIKLIRFGKKRNNFFRIYLINSKKIYSKKMINLGYFKNKNCFLIKTNLFLLLKKGIKYTNGVNRILKIYEKKYKK
ncbi:hypothetical protein ACT2CR_00240 [Candidatus Vidania fulgoroideorum]